MRKNVIFVFCLALCVSSHLFANNKVLFTSQNLDNYPIVKAKFFLYSNRILPDFNFNKSNLELKDNSVLTNIDDFQIPFQSPFPNVSLVSSLDLSVNNNGTQSNFILAKRIIETIIDSLPVNTSEIAISSFDISSYLNSEFTNDKLALKNALIPISSKTGALIEKGFNYFPSGSIEISKNANYNKSIILITDGNKPFNPDAIIANANAQNIRIFCFVLSKTANANLKKIAVSTGGQCFENINYTNYEDYVNQFVSFLYNYKPCEITWTNSIDCESLHSIELNHTSKNISGNIYIEVPDKFKPTLEIVPPYLQFSAVKAGLHKDMNVQFYAKNSDITITDIAISVPEFTIINGWATGNNLLIPKGENRSITVRFSPVDSCLIFAMLTITSNACFGKDVYMTGGYPNTRPRNNSLKILSPNGGEHLIAGDTATVNWTGLLPKDVIQLEYNIDTLNIKKWDTLASDVTGLYYNWQIPPRYADSCLVRVIQLWPNNVGETLDFIHKNMAYNSNFNKLDGSIIISSCEDSTARIWNSYTGSVIYELKGHTGRVRWANFDPTEKYAITASEDKTIKIWDRNTGVEIKTLYGHTGEVSSANFNYDDSRVVSSGYDGKVFIWDLATGAIIKTPSDGTTKVRFATFSKDGKNVLFCVGSKAKIYNIEQDKVIKEFNTNNITVYSANYSNKEDKIVTSDINGYAKVWDINSGAELYQVIHELGTVITMNNATFSENDSLLITSASDYTARIWDAKTGAPVDTLREHRNSVMSAVFNFDGSRILTSSIDSTAKVWNLNKRDIQMDTSDYSFSIVKAKLNGETLDFKRVPIDEVKDSLFTQFVSNPTDFDFAIREVFITGTNADEFSILTPISYDTITSMTNKSIILSFSPKNLGFRKAVLNVVYPGDTLRIDLAGEGFETGIELLTEYIDFGSVDIGSLKDTSVTALLKNRTLSPVTINSIQNIGPDIEHFDIVSANSNIILQPAQVMPITIRYTPETIGRSNGVILFNYNFTGSPAKLNVFGTAINQFTDSLELTVSDVSGTPGETIEVPILIRKSTDKFTNLSGIYTEISFNSTLLEPVNSSYPSEIKDNIRTLKLNINSDFSTDKLASIYFKVGLGNDTISTLTLQNTSPIGLAKLSIKVNSGLFTLKGFCTDGGYRLFNPNARLSLSQNVPNPSIISSKVEFEVNENGNIKLYIIDAKGSIITECINNYLSIGKYSYTINTNDMPAGTYFYVLETPNNRKVKSMQVIK